MPRLTLGWDNPNHAAVFLAFLVAAGWTVWLDNTRPRLARTAAIAAATVAAVLLCYTRSRGACVALVLAEVAFWLWAGKPRELIGSLRCKTPWVALLVIVGGVTFSGLGDRFVGVVALSDGSSAARLTLWRHTLAMIAFCPLGGWGVGASGEAYMNFFQPLDDTRTYGGPSSSFLHLAAELGIPVLAAAVLPFAAALAASRRLLHSAPASGWQAIAAACFRIVAVYLVASGFSTLWMVPTLTIPALAAALALLACAWTLNGRAPVFAMTMRCALSLAVAATTFALGCLGFRLSGDYACVAVEDGCVVLRSNRAGEGPRLYLLGDSAVLGPRAVRVLRGALARLDAPAFGAIVTQDSGWARAAEAGGVAVAFGRSHLYLPPQKTDVVFVRPLQPRASNSLRPAMIILPGFDDVGDFASWHAQADANRIPIVTLRNPVMSQNAVAEALRLILHARSSQPSARAN